MSFKLDTFQLQTLVLSSFPTLGTQLVKLTILFPNQPSIPEASDQHLKISGPEGIFSLAKRWKSLGARSGEYGGSS